MKVEVEHSVRVLPGDNAGSADRQRSLSHARHALDHADPGGVTVLPGEQPEFLAAAHEFRRLGRKGVWPWHPAWTLDGGPYGKLGVAAQDALMEFGQRWPRFCALLVDKAAAGLPVEAKCVTWPAVPVESRHLMGDECLIQRVQSQQMAKLPYQVGMPAKLQFAFDALQDGRPTLLFETVAHPRHPVAADSCQRLAAPEPVRLAQQRGRVIVVAACGQCARLSAQSAELMQVDRLRIDIEHVASRAPHQPYAIAQSLPE